MNRLLIVFYAYLLTTFVCGHKKCPKSCECKDGELLCSNVPDMEKMEEIMAKVTDRSISVDRFTLKDTKLPALPSSTLFSGMGMKYMRFENVELPFIVIPIIEVSPFSGLEKLEEISFKNVSYMYNWNWTMFADLKGLEIFKAEDSLFVYVSKNFSHIKAPLKQLTLTGCKTIWIQDGAFATFSELTHLFLNDNKISSFPRSILPNPAKNLRTINLRDNKIESLPGDFFKDMPQLSSVNLINNRLSVLSIDITKHMKHMEASITLYVEDNPFICDCDLFWICEPSKSLKFPKHFNIDYGVTTTCANSTNHRIRDMCSNEKGCKK